MCDKLRIDRWLAGSDPGHLGRGGKHTSTGLAEKHIDLQKLAMLNMHADCLEQGVQASPADICDECMMAQNTILSYGGVTPATALMGVNPRELEEYESAAQPARSPSVRPPRVQARRGRAKTEQQTRQRTTT